MATEFKLYPLKREELYVNKTKEEKEKIRYEMVKMALERGYKPTARYFNTYPATVRRWVQIYQTQGIEGLRFKKKGGK